MNSTMMVVTVIGSRFMLNLSALALIVGAFIVQPAAPAPIGLGVKFIRNELDKAREHEVPSSISFDNLQDAYSESDKFSDMKIEVDIVNEIKERRPTIELTVNLLVAMSNQYYSIANGRGDSAPQAEREFIERLQVFYNALYNEYSTKATYNRPCVESEKADALIKSILETSDSQPLSRQLIEAAKKEYGEQIMVFNEIKSTDLPQEFEQLNSLVNYLNMDETELLVKLVFPLLEQQDPIDFAELRYKFTDAFEQLNYQRKGDGIIDISTYLIASDDFDLESLIEQQAADSRSDSPEASGASTSKTKSE